VSEILENCLKYLQVVTFVTKFAQFAASFLVIGGVESLGFPKHSLTKNSFIFRDTMVTSL
jgi:hypothetical protein